MKEALQSRENRIIFSIKDVQITGYLEKNENLSCIYNILQI
jgi:hypothetical protein